MSKITQQHEMMIFWQLLYLVERPDEGVDITKGAKPLSSVAGWYIPHRQEYVSYMPHTATQAIVDRRRVCRVMIDQRSRTKRKAYKKAVSTLFHVVENYSASLKTNADESKTSAGVGASTASILCLVDSRFDSYTGEP